MGNRFVAFILSAVLTAGCASAQSQGLGQTDAEEGQAPVSEPAEPSSCPADTLWLRGDFGKARFAVDVADTSEKRSRGLMFVEKMPLSRGMLFVYPHPQSVSFWMKNTLIPLDMVFADARGVVTHVHSNAIPGDLTPIPGGEGVQFVLEINGGLAKQLRIAPGAEIQHAAIGDPAWPCE